MALDAPPEAYNGPQMRELIKRTGLTQDKIAQELGVSLRTVSYLGSDKRSHAVSKTLRMALEQLAK